MYGKSREEKENGTRYYYAPWRETYVKNFESTKEPQKINSCVFCDQINSNNDEKYKIIKANDDFILMINANPYCESGAFMIIPYDHKPDIVKLGKKLRSSLVNLLRKVSFILKTLGYKNFVVGINEGKISGASIPEHVHVHIATLQRFKSK